MSPKLRPKENPFRTERLDSLSFRFSERSWSELIGRLQQNGFRGAIVGKRGSGKTRLLEEWAPRLERLGFRVHLFRPETAPRRVWGRGDAVLLDSAETLGFFSWMAWRWRTRGAGAFAVSAHREGRLPTLHCCETSPELLSELVQELAPGYPLKDAAALWARHGGNLRLAFSELFDRTWMRGFQPGTFC